MTRSRIHIQPRRARRSSLLAVVAATSAVAAGCGSDTATTETPEAEQLSERIEALAVEARELQEETVEIGRELAEDPEARDEARSRLEELANEARDLEKRVEEEAPDAPEADSVSQAADQVELGAMELMEFAESEREEQFTSARELLREADQELDGVAQDLDTRLGEDELRQLEELRREIPELPRL